MLVIRLNRVGKKNKAQFRIVVQEHSVAPGGRHVEVVGSYDPHLKKAILQEDRIQYWISQGAKPSVTLHNILVSKGIIKADKIAIKMRKKAKKEDSPAGEEGKEDAASADTPEGQSEEKKPAEEPKEEEPKKKEGKSAGKTEEKKPEKEPNPPAGGEEKSEKAPKKEKEDPKNSVDKK